MGLRSDISPHLRAVAIVTALLLVNWPLSTATFILNEEDDDTPASLQSGKQTENETVLTDNLATVEGDSETPLNKEPHKQIEDRTLTITCPTPVESYYHLSKALLCSGRNCSGIACDKILLTSFEDFAYGPKERSAEIAVLRDVVVSASDDVLWYMGSKEKGVRVTGGHTLTLKDIVVEAILRTSINAFLQPQAMSVEAGSSLVLHNVTYLTTSTGFEAVRKFAVNKLPVKDFVIQPAPDGSPSLTVFSHFSQKVNATNVTVKQWSFPKADNEGRVSIGVSDSSRLREILSVVSTEEKYSDVSELDVLSDIFIDPKDWPRSGITVNRNITLAGVRLVHHSLVKIPLLDLRLVSQAVKIAPGAVVELSNVEVLNLALGPLDAHYGFLMYFFEFNRSDEDLAIVIRNSRLVVSCAEIEHFEYAVALIGDPLRTLVNELDQLKLDPTDWQVTTPPQSGVISVERANAYGIELHNVNFTCVASHGDVMDANFELGSPLTLTTGRAETPEPEDSGGKTEDGDSESLATVFDILLGVLIPSVVILTCLLVCKIRHHRQKVAKAGVRKAKADIEGGDVASDLVGGLGDKSLKHSISDSFDMKDQLHKLPSQNSPEMLKLGAGNLQLSPADMGNPHAAEFIPDILAVSEEIDDKQLVVKELLGQGQHASVHKGIWRELDVAVKTIVFRGEYDSKDSHQRAIREVAITSGLAHPNVVCTYSYDIKRLQAGLMEAGVAGLKKDAGINILDSCVDWKLFIIQEYCEKGTLQDALKARAFVDERTGNPDLESLLEVASGIVKGMHHIHSKNILHGNLKPSNVLLKKAPDTHTKMVAKIADFGLSLKLSSDQTHVSNAQCGTPFYMAREVLEKGNASKAADVYAFGVMLWEMYTSQLSPTGEPTEDMFSQFPRLPWSCPAPYGVLAIACMHPVPSARPSFNDIMEYLWSLWQLQQRLGTLMPPPVLPSQTSKSRFCNDIVQCPHPLKKCIVETLPSGHSPVQSDSDADKVSGRRRAYFWKSMAGMPEKFKNIEYEQVYWPETDESGLPLGYD